MACHFPDTFQIAFIVTYVVTILTPKPMHTLRIGFLNNVTKFIIDSENVYVLILLGVEFNLIWLSRDFACV